MLAITAQTATQSAGAIAGPLLFAAVARFLGLTVALFAAALFASPVVVLPHFLRARGRVDTAEEGSTV
ncbi:MAG: hypothetical protein ACE5EF_07880, partial [Dehalococcoidia bacterium]